MSRMIQIRNVPDVLHRTLKARAALAGMTLSDYLLKEIGAVAAHPTLEEVLARIKSQGPPGARLDSAKAIRAEREARR